MGAGFSLPGGSRKSRRSGSSNEPDQSDPLLLELHVQAETADLVGQDVEAGGSAGLERVFTLDHAHVDLGPPLDIVGLDGPWLQRKSEF